MNRLVIAVGAVVLLLVGWRLTHPLSTLQSGPAIYVLPPGYKLPADFVSCTISSPGEGPCTNVKTGITYHFCDWDASKPCRKD